MTTQELRCRMHHNVSSVLQRTNQIRCTKRVVDDKRNTVLVGHSSHTFEVEHVRVGVAESLGIYYFCVGLDSSFERLEVVHIDNRIRDALSSQRVGNQIIASTIKIISSHDMIAILYDVLQRIGDSSSTRGNGQSGYTTLEGCHAILEHTLSRVGQTTVDITCIAKTETIGCVLRVVENIARGLIDGHCASVSCGVSLFLAYMKL